MGRLFSGTKWDRPPTCDRCGLLESDCACPPLPPPAPVLLDPSTQTARLRVEKRPKGKVATVVSGLDPSGNDLPALCTRLKTSCGSGGTVKDGTIEIQGDHLSRVESCLSSLGYRTRKG
jgi:translation initiation factor 1